VIRDLEGVLVAIRGYDGCLIKSQLLCQLS
jgi:hypothetical protein